MNYKSKAKELAAVIRRRVPVDVKVFLSDLSPIQAVRLILLTVKSQNITVDEVYELLKN